MFCSNPAMCPMTYDLKNGDQKFIMNDDKPEYNMVMTCDEGYTMVGVKNFTCKGGLWDRIPSGTTCVSMYVFDYVNKYTLYIHNYLYVCMYVH